MVMMPMPIIDNGNRDTNPAKVKPTVPLAAKICA